MEESVRTRRDSFSLSQDQEAGKRGPRHSVGDLSNVRKPQPAQNQISVQSLPSDNAFDNVFANSSTSSSVNSAKLNQTQNQNLFEGFNFSKRDVVPIDKNKGFSLFKQINLYYYIIRYHKFG